MAMTGCTAVAADTVKNGFSSLNDNFCVSGARNEYQLSANPKGSFRLSVGIHAVPVYVAFGSLAALSHPMNSA